MAYPFYIIIYVYLIATYIVSLFIDMILNNVPYHVRDRWIAHCIVLNAYLYKVPLYYQSLTADIYFMMVLIISSETLEICVF